MKIKFLLLAFLLLCIGLTSSAKYVQTCKAKYKTNYEWSKYYTVDVTFISGSELNTATSTYNYASYSTYAVIFWGDDKATVIKLSSYTGCGTEVTKDCISNTIGNLKGEDQEGRDWEVCVSGYCY
ncbi:hypothetical protein SAMN05444285_102245 [Draconibacterium orientale]|uniref:Uncharacterized protein n=1 Tax=Draconibacterium orientale TaxID=1168034 RepID=A0A1H9ZSW7_9BACT|nr:hypothetical protein SAMN05444285_102245 [Draconibacterium orientale]